MARPRVIVVLDIVDQLSTLYVSHLACIFARSTFLQGLDVHIPLSCQVDGLSIQKRWTQYNNTSCRTVGLSDTVFDSLTLFDTVHRSRLRQTVSDGCRIAVGLSDCRTVRHCRTVRNLKRPCEAVADLHRPCEAAQAA